MCLLLYFDVETILSAEKGNHEMRLNRFAAAAMLLAILAADTALAARRIYTLTGLKRSNDQSAGQKPTNPGDTEKPFSELTKDRVVIPGLFAFYRDTASNSLYMAIKSTQIDQIFLCGATISRSEGAFFDNGAMDATFPFYFKRVGKKIMMMEKNLRFRTDSSAAMRKAVEAGISDHLYATAKIESKPDSSGTILVDASNLFIRDADNVNYFVGQLGQTGVSFDRDNSYFELVKSFPENAEIDVKLHYRTSKPIDAVTMQNPYSLFHTYHYSLSSMPATDYVPRVADDRVGHFLTVYQDYSALNAETPYVRYVERWSVKKKDPDARISEPVEPIVFWIENTVPKEYRGAVAEGIEFWNPAFERIGIRHAIVAREMPDTASWDPADARYNTVRWILAPGGGYAVGPHRSNPYTGQIYDADIRVSSDFIRYMFMNMARFIGPLSADGSLIAQDNPQEWRGPYSARRSPYACEYGEESAREAGFGLTYLLSSIGDFAEKDSLTKEYIHAYITELIAHEVGHTLGFRHNFKASTAYTLEQVNDPEFTRLHSTGGTVMDYTPPNIAGKERKQGEFYASVPGPYDNWVIEYAYRDFGAKNPQEELPRLKEIASRAAEPELAYGTDEDAFGTSPRSIDPMCNLFDCGNDPLKYAEHKIRLTRELWGSAMKKFEKPGERYQRILAVFQGGWRSYTESAQLAPKYIGGLRHHRDHIGDPNGRSPFEPVAASEQRRAIAFLAQNFFAAEAFALPAELLNMLQAENLEDFEGSSFRISQVDYPFHQMVLNAQRGAIDKLYSALTLGRLLNNLERVKPGTERYTMYDMFTDLRKNIWTEAFTPSNVNSFRRPLQLVHLSKVIEIYLSNPALYPADAHSLAAHDLDAIEAAASKALMSSALDNMSQVHFKEVLRQIAAAKKAQRQFSSGMMLGFGG